MVFSFETNLLTKSTRQTPARHEICRGPLQDSKHIRGAVQYNREWKCGREVRLALVPSELKQRTDSAAACADHTLSVY